MRCGTEVRRETVVKQYPFYCPNCDENLFEIETTTTERYSVAVDGKTVGRFGQLMPALRLAKSLAQRDASFGATVCDGKEKAFKFDAYPW
jgi:hypothetical protein